MQSLTITTEHNPNSHPPAEILDALRGRDGVRRWSFRYELLSSAHVKLDDLDQVTSCEVTQNWLATGVKRTARFQILDLGGIDYLSDRIKPWIRLGLSPYGVNDWVEWPQGVFLLATPTRSVDAAGVVTRAVDGFDPAQSLLDDSVTTRYTVTAGTAYTTAVATLLGSIPQSVVASASTLPAAREWEPGTNKLKIINELLTAVNYESLAFDENGVAIVKPYLSPASRPAEYTYSDDEDGVMLPAVDQTLDLFNVPNSWTLVVSNPDRVALSSTYTNTDPASPTSTVRRQRTIVSFQTEQDAADQAALDAKVARLAFEASQVYEKISFTTGLMPIHSGNDVIGINYSPLAINAKYAETSWNMTLKAGAQMKHEIRRVVAV